MLNSTLNLNLNLTRNLTFDLTLAFALVFAVNAHAQTTVTQGPRIVNENDGSADGEPALKAKVAQAERLSHSRNAFSRSVRDMATWDFEWLASNPNWVVAEIAPSIIPTFTPAVTATATSTAVKEEKNAATVTPNANASQHSLVWGGALLVLKPLGATPARAVWPYRYTRVVDSTRTIPDAIGTEAHERYSPFIHAPVDSQKSNFGFCSVPETIQNVQTPNNGLELDPKSHRAHLLFEDSLRWVMPAQTFYETNPAFFSPEKATQNRARLVALLDDENPFLFAAAARTLARAGEFDGDFISKKLLTLDKFRQAVFVYSTLLYSRTTKGIALIGQSVGEAKSKEQLEGLILGTEQANRTWQDCLLIDPSLKKIAHAEMFVSPSVTSPKIPTIVRYALSSMIVYYDRQRTLGVVTDNDKYLFSITSRAAQEFLPDSLPKVK